MTFLLKQIKQKYTYLLLLCLSISLVSCQQEPVQPEQRDITVAQAKAHFSEHIKTNGRGSGLPGSGHPGSGHPEISWDQNWYEEASNGDILFFPLDFGKEKYISSSTAPDVKFQASAASYAMAYIREGEVTLEQVQWIPTGTYHEGFTGVGRVTDWQGNPLRYYIYENGIFVNGYLAKVNATYTNGRLAFSDCDWIDSFTCTVRDVGPDDCVWDGGYAVCDGGGNKEPFSFSPEDPTPIGGGGVLGDGPNMCPHPYLQGQYIDCEEEVCAEGSIKDANGNCIDLEILWQESICRTNKFKENECVNGILDRILEEKIAYDILKNFLGKFPKGDLCFDLASYTSNINGLTNNNTYIINISINSNKLNRSSLSIARTILHEIVHAEMFRMVNSAGGTVDKEDFPALYDYIRKHFKNYQHELMAAEYVGFIAEGLADFDNHSQNQDVYEAIAWLGLYLVKDKNNPSGPRIHTEAWKQLSQVEQRRILTLISNFKANENTTCQ